MEVHCIGACVYQGDNCLYSENDSVVKPVVSLLLLYYN